jgi:TatD DNase family protein
MFDSHAHVAMPQFDGELHQILDRAQRAGVRGWIEIGTDIAQSQKAIALAQQLPNVWSAAGVHPRDIGELDEEGWTKITSLLSETRVVAVGEVGLDYYHGRNNEEQAIVLRRFINLANERNLPVIFHVRNAHEDLLALLDGCMPHAGGVIHTFSGTWDQAQRYVALGLHISFSGVVTFKNGQEIRDIAARVPLDRLLIETDCPFLAPEPYRGKRNEPAYAALVMQKIAELRNMPLAELAAATAETTRRLFRIPA